MLIPFSRSKQFVAHALVVSVALLLTSPSFRLWAAAEQTFASPELALNRLVEAAKNYDTNTMRAIFGPEGHQLVSPDVVQATQDFRLFVQRLTQRTQWVTNAEGQMNLELGDDAWPFPIPLVEQNGQWFFDTAAGRTEILNRRVGKNELGAIGVCRAYVEAQREYASRSRNGEEVLAYSQHLHSNPGTRDGLYWSAKPGEISSPLGPLVAAARVEGYHRAARMLNDQLAPYHGYYFKILTAQGRHAPGGKYNYLINGRMIAGFGLVAWPAQWHNTGVMTFIVNQQGKVFQRDLGKNTEHAAAGMTVFDPDPRWQPVP